MYSFLAFLEGGYSTSDEQTSTTSSSNEKEGHAKAGFKFPSLFNLFGAEAGLDASLANKLESTVEYKAERHRTEASLFNHLYGQLRAANRITSINNARELAEAGTGQLVEIYGKYNGNPLAEILSFANQFFTYFEPSEDSAKPANKTPKNPQRSGNPATRNASPPEATASLIPGFGDDPGTRYMIKVFKEMHRDLENSPVQDLLVTTFGDLKTVITVSAEYFTGATREFLREGDIRVMGKLTRSLSAGEQINLSRRTIMGIANNEATQTLISSFGTSPGVNFNAADPIVAGPAAQILPMAVFV